MFFLCLFTFWCWIGSWFWTIKRTNNFVKKINFSLYYVGLGLGLGVGLGVLHNTRKNEIHFLKNKKKIKNYDAFGTGVGFGVGLGLGFGLNKYQKTVFFKKKNSKKKL